MLQTTAKIRRCLCFLRMRCNSLDRCRTNSHCTENSIRLQWWEVVREIGLSRSLYTSLLIILRTSLFAASSSN